MLTVHKAEAVTRTQLYYLHTVNIEGWSQKSQRMCSSQDLATNWQSESCLSFALGLEDKMKTPETFKLIWSNVREKELHHLQFLVNAKKD